MTMTMETFYSRVRILDIADHLKVSMAILAGVLIKRHEKSLSSKHGVTVTF
jgi:hypothetical protein